MSEERWITVTDAAAILRMTPRQVNRYGNENRLVTKRSGRRVLYLMSSVTALADELQVDIRPAAPQASLAQIAQPVTEIRDYLQKLVEAQRDLEQLIRAPSPTGPTKEELRDLLREVIAEQRKAEQQEQEALRSQEKPRTPRVYWLIVGLLVIILAVVIYGTLMR